VQYNGSINGPVAASTVKLDAFFSGTLTLNSVFQVANGLEEDNGAISQPGGVGASDVKVDGALFDWAGGVLNSSATKGIIYLLNNGSATLTGGILKTGDDLNIGNFIVHVQNTGPLIFNNNSGLIIGGGTFSLEQAGQALIDGNGTGVVQNNGGFFVKSTLSGNNKIECTLPYINAGAGAILSVRAGTLQFTKTTTQNNETASVFQNTGLISLYNATVLKVPGGLVMSGGQLTTNGKASIDNPTANVTVHGGTVSPGGGAGSFGTLTCTGNVLMDGGTYLAEVDLTDPRNFDQWTAASFNIGGKATLTVNSLNIPNPLKTYNFLILKTTALNKVQGDFATFTDNLAIPGTGKNFKHGLDPQMSGYIIYYP
jgi:hypothetical protein